MLRQLARLCRPVPAAGPRALALAVYADEMGQTLVAEDCGLEGVACVDDVARAAMVLCDVWKATGQGWVRTWADSLLDFVMWMEDGKSGRWFNFIKDWDGTRNANGSTSFSGGEYWEARALGALTRAWVTFGDERARDAADRASHEIVESHVAPDIRVMHIQAALDRWRCDSRGEDARLLGLWAEELVQAERGDLLINNVDERGHPHLWGHIQEGVLADIGVALEKPEYIVRAERSAAPMFFDLIDNNFNLPALEAYGVASAIFVMDRLTAATGKQLYAEMGEKARQWFDGRNPARKPMYDREAGKVLDGIREGKINPHSGAESNICGAQALFSEVVERALRVTSCDELPFSDEVKELLRRS